MKIARAIRKGWIIPGKKQIPQKQKVYDLWHEQDDQSIKKNHIPAPKVKLPEHIESYNPPAEYLFSEKELQEWNALDPEDREHNFLPQKFSSLRQVPAYDKFIQEQFSRCLDLYLCPRMIKQKVLFIFICSKMCSWILIQNRLFLNYQVQKTFNLFLLNFPLSIEVIQIVFDLFQLIQLVNF